MKKYNQGFMTLTFVLFITAFLMFVILANTSNETNLEAQLSAIKHSYNVSYSKLSQSEMAKLESYINF